MTRIEHLKGTKRQTRKGRPVRAESETIDLEIINCLDENTEFLRRERISPPKGRPKSPRVCAPLTEPVLRNVDDILQLFDGKKRPELGRRSLQKKLKKWSGMKVAAEVVRKGSAYYYMMRPKDSLYPAFRWQKMVKPFIDNMNIEDSEGRASYLLFAKGEDPIRLLSARFDAIVLGSGTKFLTRFYGGRGSETEKQNFLDRLIHSTESTIIDQLKRVYESKVGVRTNGDIMTFSKEKLGQIEGKMKALKFAFIYVIDGSDLWSVKIPAE